MFSYQFIVFILLITLGLAMGAKFNQSALPYPTFDDWTSIKIDSSTITSSGLSSGAFMSLQLQVAFSATFSGCAVVAGGPYYCALDSLERAEMACMYALEKNNIDALVTITENFARQGLIDDTANMADARAFLFSATRDTVVNTKVVQDAETYLKRYMKDANIESYYKLDAEHCMPTLNYGEPCTRLESPYLGDCSYDGAGSLLKSLYDHIETRGTVNDDNYFSFDQASFISGTASGASMDSTGYMYIPSACQDGETTCHLHIALHGCEQSYTDVGTAFVEHGGYNSWAEANNIVVVYPQTIPSRLLGNPNSCFDWWGFTGSDYAVKSGVQMAAVKNIVDAFF